MKKEDNLPAKFHSIAEAHQAFGLPAPKHPLISLLGSENVQADVQPPAGSHVLNFYKISYQPPLGGRLRYGQHYYDFDGGGLLFASPGQIIGPNMYEGQPSDYCSMYALLIHPDFLLGHPLAKKIRQYGFFSYVANEVLHLSEDEKTTILSIFRMIQAELNSRIDDFSQDVVLSQIELLLSYASRFYKRQFITRKAVNNNLLLQLEDILEEYFGNEQSLSSGIPTVQYLADRLHLSPGYLSDMLRSLTGQSTQQHIHHKLIEKAKELISTTSLSVSEIAYRLGFGYPQSFSKLFKTKTQVSPLEFRQSFN